MYKDKAMVNLDGRYSLGLIDVSSIKFITAKLFEECFQQSLEFRVKNLYNDLAKEMIGRVTINPLDESYQGNRTESLGRAFEEAIDNNIFSKKHIGLMSIDTLDRMTRMKNKKEGFWRVYEPDSESGGDVTIRDRMFIKARSKGRHGVGYLISRQQAMERGMSPQSFKEHTFSVRGKRYARNFVESFNDVFLSKAFMDSIMHETCARIINRIRNKSTVTETEKK
jgi:hypothetical protein